MLSALAQRAKAYWGYDDAFMAACAGELTWSEADIASGTIWIAESEAGEVLGFCDLRARDHVLEVEALYVDPPAMGLGAGTALWRRTEEMARRLTVRAIGLDADPNAVGFYQRMGAEITGEAPSGSIPGRFLPRMKMLILSQESQAES